LLLALKVRFGEWPLFVVCDATTCQQCPSFCCPSTYIVHCKHEQTANYALLSPIQAAFVSEIVVVFGGECFAVNFFSRTRRAIVFFYERFNQVGNDRVAHHDIYWLIEDGFDITTN
jgi:hypothetical protein